MDYQYCAVADPGFPIGGRGPFRGRGPPKMYAKTKEFGPVGA